MQVSVVLLQPHPLFRSSKINFIRLDFKFLCLIDPHAFLEMLDTLVRPLSRSKIVYNIKECCTRFPCRHAESTSNGLSVSNRSFRGMGKDDVMEILDIDPCAECPITRYDNRVCCFLHFM